MAIARSTIPRILRCASSINARSWNISGCATVGLRTSSRRSELNTPTCFAPSMPKADALAAIARSVVTCRRCPELRAYIAQVASEKRRAYADREYWGRPVPLFGDANARLLLVGLAPGAHGSNRTGRPFTG